MNTANVISNTYCVYRHIRPDKDEPFYIGIGGDKRPARIFNRNKHWKNIYNLNNKNIQVDILEEELSWEQACEKEVWWIAFYGRNDIGKGPLCNLTDGGNGTVGVIMSEDHKKKIAEANKGNPSHTGKIYITDGNVNRLINKDDIVPDKWYRGKLQNFNWSQEAREKMSINRRGRNLNLSIEERVARSERTKGNKSTSGKTWITDGVLSKYIKLNDSIPEGWRKGRTKIKNNN